MSEPGSNLPSPPTGIMHSGEEPPPNEPSAIGTEILDPTLVSPETAILQARFSGPLPLPDHLDEYNRIIPNGAERIMRMAEEDAELSREMIRRQMSLSEKQLDAQIADNRSIRWEKLRGQVGGFLIILFVFGVSAWLIHDGHNVAGAIGGTGGVAGLVGTFMYGHKVAAETRPNDKELKDLQSADHVMNPQDKLAGKPEESADENA